MPRYQNRDRAQSVALRKESVDRNAETISGGFFVLGSLSARRAWIEILMSSKATRISVVALRKESVDRNIQDYNIGVRARVALRKESVDRNKMQPNIIPICMGRSPQGERG